MGIGGFAAFYVILIKKAGLVRDMEVTEPWKGVMVFLEGEQKQRKKEFPPRLCIEYFKIKGGKRPCGGKKL